MGGDPGQDTARLGRELASQNLALDHQPDQDLCGSSRRTEMIYTGARNLITKTVDAEISELLTKFLSRRDARGRVAMGSQR